jgi:hypothetical protein
MLRSWRERDINDLISAWGPPNSTYNMPNGNKMYTWSNIKVGPTVSEGNAAYLGYGVSSANSVSITPTWDCHTTMITTPEGKIVSWHLKGNSCVMPYSKQELRAKLEALQAMCECLQKGDHIHLSFYNRPDEEEERQGAWHHDVYFDKYHSYNDSISVGRFKTSLNFLTDEIYHLEYVEDITKIEAETASSTPANATAKKGEHTTSGPADPGTLPSKKKSSSSDAERDLLIK